MVVAVIAAIAIGFYYFASPYEQCVRFVHARGGDTERDVVAAVARKRRSSETNW